ncbi:response regulator transcription factor [Pseudomonas sp. TH31]|uniref:response regulator transcription factor n=1 Tax=Pseudomonas sp. TH31 TaxID=2796396 RepID=UPI001911D70E|nr:response regulator transcription factor [Pseudomonas sp. TH31]MBK5415367.1 response regulator transcription factor [Pseudomonas sp. TH31]
MNNRILVADDHPAIRMTIQFLLASEGFNVVAETNNGADAIELVKWALPIDINSGHWNPRHRWLTVISKITTKYKLDKIAVLTGLPSSPLAEHYRKLGAHGFVSKQNELYELVLAVRAVRTNEDYFPNLPSFPRHRENLGQESELLQRLTTCELRVMQQLLHGMSNKAIADHMKLSSKTVTAQA